MIQVPKLPFFFITTTITFPFQLLELDVVCLPRHSIGNATKKEMVNFVLGNNTLSIPKCFVVQNYYTVFIKCVLKIYVIAIYRLTAYLISSFKKISHEEI